MLDVKLKIMDKMIPNKKNILLDSFNFYPNINIDKLELYNYRKEYLKKNNNIPIKFYIHIPFCQTICKYCQYDTILIKGSDQVEKYLNSLFEYLDFFKLLFKDIKFKGLYIGGGTPSILSVNQLEKLFNYLNYNFSFSDEYYNTIELNPSSTNFNKLDVIYKFGIINRVSFGVQSFNKETLKLENRHFSSKVQISNLVNYSKCLGFKDVNLDIIFGLNNELKSDLLYNINLLKEIQPYSITVYTILKNIEKSILFKRDSESFYDNVDNIYKDILRETDILDYFDYDEWSNVLGFNLYLKGIKRFTTKSYEAHTDDIESLFSVGYKSFGKIRSYGEYRFQKGFNKVYFYKTTKEIEEYKFILQAFQYKIDINSINCKLGINFLEKFKKELYFLEKKSIIKKNNKDIFYIGDKNYIGYWALLLLDFRLLILFIRFRFYLFK